MVTVSLAEKLYP